MTDAPQSTTGERKQKQLPSPIGFGYDELLAVKKMERLHCSGRQVPSPMGGFLEALGVRLREVRVIPDDRAKIVATVNECRAAFDYVITTGGIGPTHDDITSECVAEAFGVGMYRDPETVELIPHDQGTRLRLSHAGFLDDESRKGHDDAWPAALEHLDTVFHATP